MRDKYTRERDVAGKPQTTRFAETEKRQAETNNLGLMASDGEPDLSDQTPVDIDTKLAKLYTERARTAASVDNAVTGVLAVVQPYHWGRKKAMTNKEALDEANRQIEDTATASHVVSILNGYLAHVHSGNEKVDMVDADIDSLDTEFKRRGGWTRAFLVNNVNGHVHRSMNCSTCYDTTQYVWMTDYSGGTEEAVVEDGGDRICTVCYPSAPVESLNRPTKMFSEEEKQAKGDRAERAAAKMERDAKQLAKAILPTGEPLKIPNWIGSNGNVHYDHIQSLVAARTRLTDYCEEWRRNDSECDQQAKEMLAEAIAAKEDKTVEQVLGEAAKRAAKRK